MEEVLAIFVDMCYQDKGAPFSFLGGVSLGDLCTLTQKTIYFLAKLKLQPDEQPPGLLQ